MTEAQLQRRVCDLADWLHLRWHHETDSRYSKPGFPDLVIAGPGGVVFAELKSETGRIRDEQQQWLEAIAESGTEAYIWRPSMWDAIEKTLRRLAQERPCP